MAPLPSNLRRDLERTIIEAREVAEEGSRDALEALTVHEGKRGSHLSDSDAVLRNRLRAHARQIGDRRNSQSGTQTIDRLVQECAYEHWHRMIFARFLAENNLLVEPDSQVSVTLVDVEELAQEEGIDPWELAARFAQNSLPAIFRNEDPLLQVALPRESRLRLESLLEDLPATTFLADDSLGWVYQFWQSAEKERVNKQGSKISGDTLPAVTQLFTEHYMVLFLLHNTIGAWYAAKVLSTQPELAVGADGEEELREALRLNEVGGYSFDYLRFVRDEPTGEADSRSCGRWRPMAGTFPGWPERVADLKVLDPCCGSGHFLVAAFELLVRLRMREEELTAVSAIDRVLRENLFGLELDSRCTQIAVFNLAVASWKLGGPRQLPPMNNVACSGLSVGVSRDAWMKALDRSEGSTELRFYFGQLHDMFINASTLGSLINPRRFLGSHMLTESQARELTDALAHGISLDPNATPEAYELGLTSQGLARAAEMLADRYHLVLTNVPYLGRGKQGEVLKKHIDTYYGRGKADLATAFVLRCIEFCDNASTAAMVSPQNWWFLSSYTALRELLLANKSFMVGATLGEEAWQAFGDRGPVATLTVIRDEYPSESHQMAGIDALPLRTIEEKDAWLANGDIRHTLQTDIYGNPDHRITVEEPIKGELLARYAESLQGVSPADFPKYGRCFWEVDLRDPWRPWQSAVNETKPYGGRSLVIWWNADLMAAVDDGTAYIRGKKAWGKVGVAMRQMRDLPATIYSGDIFDTNTAVILPKTHAIATAIWAFAESGELAKAVRRVDKKVNVTNASFVKIPFDREHWEGIAEQKYPQGLPEPESDDPKEWLFHGRPDTSTEPEQVAVARTVGYKWPAEYRTEFQMSKRATALVASCDELRDLSDEDGIVCIPAVRGEEPAAVRLAKLRHASGLSSQPDLDHWLRNTFFQDHIRLFDSRPFVWHIWDGRKADGFHALVNYHKLTGPNGQKLLENLTYSYLGDWVSRQESDLKQGESGAEGRLLAAQMLQTRLIAILKGEPPYDIFVRWKPLCEQPIGWNPDINDGVRINIRPFMAVDIPGGLKGAGILRVKPKIRWSKDRGKEPKRPRAEFPWFWGWDESEDFAGGDTFTGERWNDCHYTNAFKQQARDAAKDKQS